MKYILYSLLLLVFLLPGKAFAQVHNRPVTTAALSPSPTSPYNGLNIYSDPVTVTLTATVDSGYTATTYYELDGGAQQTYSGSFIVTGTGKHSVEFWSVDNTGIEELNHNTISFTINYQHATITSLTQDGNNIDVAVNIDNIQPYLDYINVSSGGGSNCWNDLNMGFVLFNATTGSVVSSYSGQGAERCVNIGTPSDGNQALSFDPIQLPSGTYQIYYFGGNFDWITDPFVYTASAAPHNAPTTTASLSPTPSSPANGLNIYSDPVTVTLSATADTGYSIANTYYKVDGGAQQTYSGPFTVTGTGKHAIEYWSIDNTGLSEASHESKTFTINYQHATITSLTQDGNNIDVAINIDNIQPYLDYINTSSGGGSNCWNDLSMGFELLNTTTGAVMSSYSGQGAERCVNIGTPSDGNQALSFDPIQLPSGTYQIYYFGGNFDWITDPFVYTAPVPAHNAPVTTAVLTPSPTSPLQGLTFYSDPVTVTLTATADTGYSIVNTYYKVDGGAQQTYSGPFTVTGTGKHSIEYWSIDNSGISEAPHESQAFTINYQHATITSIDQNGLSITAAIHLDNIQPYLDEISETTGGGSNCWNDGNIAYEIYDATTGASVGSYSGDGSFRCQNIGTPSDGNQALYFPPVLLPVGTYEIHYSGDTFDWITDPFVYAPSPVTTASLTTQNSDGTYSNPATVTLSASSAIGTTVANTYYTVDGGTQQTYTSPFTVSGNGNHVITYWSVDSIGTQEPQNTTTFTIGAFNLSGEVYNDTNRNGVQDSGETGYNGATVTLNTGQSTTTDSNGNYSFPNLEAGSYTETLTLPSGYVATTTNPVSVPLSANTTENFGIAPATTTLTPIHDSFIQHNEQNSNEGASPFLELSVEGKERALVQFNESQIQAAIGGDPNYTATLQFTIVSNNNKWSTGRQIDLNRMEQSWTEGNGSYNYNNNRGTGSGVTWDCATDTNITNQSDNCSGSTVWDMLDSGTLPFNTTPTATTTITNNQSGTVSFNVTSDVKTFLSGTNSNYGWILKKDDETADGDIQFGSRETGNTPKLIITLH